MKKVVMYINQFFGQIGGEEKADIGPQLREGPVGPAVALNGLLQDAQITHTIICGDNYMGEKIEQAAQNISDLLSGIPFDLFIAGPAFQAGRYGGLRAGLQSGGEDVSCSGYHLHAHRKSGSRDV